MRHFVTRQWFVIALLVVLVSGANKPDWFAGFASQKTLHTWIVAVVMFLTTLPVNFQSIRKTVARPATAMVAIAVSYVLIPLLGWMAMRWFSPDLALGIMVAAVTPTTLATGAVWTRRAGGNDVIPIMVTIVTNMTCFAVAPLWLWMTVNTSTELDLPVGSTMQKLFLLVVLPMLCGQVARVARRIATWTSANQKVISTTSLIGILSIVLVGAVQCGQKFRDEGISPLDRGGEFFAMLVVVASIHMIALAVGWYISNTLNFERGDAIGVSFAGSQKTLMVGLQLALMVGGGLVIVPLFTYHFFQLVFDTFVADHWRSSKLLEGEPSVGRPGGHVQHE